MSLSEFKPDKSDGYRSELDALYLCHNFYSKKRKFKANFFFFIKGKEDLRNYDELKILTFYVDNVIYGFATIDNDRNEKEVQIFMMPKKCFKGYGLILLLNLEKYIYINYNQVREIYAQCNDLSENTFITAGYDDDMGDLYKRIR